MNKLLLLSLVESVPNCNGARSFNKKFELSFSDGSENRFATNEELIAAQELAEQKEAKLTVAATSKIESVAELPKLKSYLAINNPNAKQMQDQIAALTLVVVKIIDGVIVK